MYSGLHVVDVNVAGAVADESKVSARAHLHTRGDRAAVLRSLESGMTQLVSTHRRTAGRNWNVRGVLECIIVCLGLWSQHISIQKRKGLGNIT